MRSPLLDFCNVSVEYRNPPERVRAISDFSLEVRPGEFVAIVGASGSGKTTLARAAMGLLPSNAIITNGELRINGQNMCNRPDSEWCKLRGTALGLILQEPASALNPMRSILSSVEEPLLLQGGFTKSERRELVIAELEQVGLSGASMLLPQRPHRLSGGMRQRVAIAAALISRPSLVFADEPTTALDPTLRLHIFEMLERRRRESNMAWVVITHDLSSVARRAQRVIVLHEGRVVESGETAQVFETPRNPVTRSMLDASRAMGSMR